ncbi:hypothetical protein FIE12Z_636 [Fusarium flagelliforme]|uniref:Uncharacterized protein n=1 Tax=Fusarium flagelliforme TaxID=2675880 RepID=A0A395N4R9_9HYPO|nr:hypothetical protein FIE12Z_636 [Fusarium flagelliforme]
MSSTEHLHDEGAGSNSENAKMSDLKRQIEVLRAENERLTSEIQSLRSGTAPTAIIAKIVKRFNLTTGDRQLDDNEIQGLCRTLSSAQSLSILVRFVDGHGMRDSDLAYCIDAIVRGDKFPVAFFWKHGMNCKAHKDARDDCVCIMRRENSWIIASGGRQCWEWQTMGSS